MKFTNSIRTSMCIAVLTLLLTISSFAQAPEKMSYQAVIRDAENALVTSQQVGMQISILQGDVAVYEETQTPTSNTNGLVSLEIGEGTVISGSFTAIDWSVDTSFIKIETDPTGGTNYTITGTSQLLSVPYALYAKTSSDASAVAVNSDKIGYTEALVSANTDVAANTAKTGITSEQTSSITANTAKTGISSGQSDAITTNTSKVGYTEALVSANTDVAANTAKTGITSEQTSSITANTAKTGISSGQSDAIIANTAKTVITSDQSDAITANTSKVGYTEAAVSANTAVVANTAKVGYTEALVSANSAVAANTAKVGSTGLSGLSDALVETNSLYIGNDPSAVTDNAEYNVAIGTTALSSNTTGDRNTAIGYYALSSNTTGKNNTANGNDALRANTEGNYNTANGNEALKANTEGSANTAIGNEALLSNTTGGYNTASGYEALRANTTGGNNTASGNSALKSNTTGPENTAIGTGALISNTEGRANTASGLSALKSNTTGGYNTASGREALTSNTTGDFNTAIGFQADVVANNLTNATAIGNGALVASSNTMQLGNTDVTNVKTSGTITAGAITIPNIDGSANQVLQTDGSGALTWATGVTTYSVGDVAQGGVVFWVDATGQHGLVAATEDQSTGMRWNAGTDGSTQAKGDGIYAGKANTSIIIAAQVAIGDDGATFAARLCNELQITESSITYGDWYLPSKFELNQLYLNKTTLEAVSGFTLFTDNFYWSSTESEAIWAWRQDFLSGSQDRNAGKQFTINVRAIRAF